MKLTVAFSQRIFDLDDTLSSSEKERMAVFSFKHLRSQYAFAHCFKRRVLSHYHPFFNERAWRFQSTSSGKPYIENRLPEKAAVAFNLSHSGDSVVLALVNSHSHQALGVDIECYRSMDDIDSMMEWVCHPEERNILMSCDNKEQVFLSLWTAKEALLKAHGSGLINDLSTLNCKQSIQGNRVCSVEWMGCTYCLKTIDLGWGVITVAWLQSIGVAELLFDDWQGGSPRLIDNFDVIAH